MLVSLYKFLQNIQDIDYAGTFEEFFELFLNNSLWFGKWTDHVNEYTKLNNVHIIHYENLLLVNLISNDIFLIYIFKYMKINKLESD